MFSFNSQYHCMRGMEYVSCHNTSSYNYVTYICSTIMPNITLVHTFVNHLYGIKDDKMSLDDACLTLLLIIGTDLDQIPHKQ